MDVIDKIHEKYGETIFGLFILCLFVSALCVLVLVVGMIMIYPILGVIIPPAVVSYLVWSVRKDD